MLTFLIVLAIIWTTWMIGIVITNKPDGYGMSTAGLIVIPFFLSIIYFVMYLFSKKVASYLMLGLNTLFALLFIVIAVLLIIYRIKDNSKIILKKYVRIDKDLKKLIPKNKKREKNTTTSKFSPPFGR